MFETLWTMLSNLLLVVRTSKKAGGTLESKATTNTTRWSGEVEILWKVRDGDCILGNISIILACIVLHHDGTESIVLCYLTTIVLCYLYCFIYSTGNDNDFIPLIDSWGKLYLHCDEWIIMITSNIHVDTFMRQTVSTLW